MGGSRGTTCAGRSAFAATGRRVGEWGGAPKAEIGLLRCPTCIDRKGGS